MLRPPLWLLALPVGYLLGWFVFGLSPLPLALLLLTLMLGLAWAEGGGSGLKDFAVLLGILAGLALFLGSLVALRSMFSLGSGYEWTGFLLPLTLLALLLSLMLPTLLLVWLRRTERTLQTTPAPWLLLAGVLAFAFFPAVRVDCRGLQADDFLSFQSDFQSHARVPRWVEHPEQVPDRAELPAAFKMEHVRAGVVGCQRRIFSFDRVRPLLVVHLTEKVQPGMKAYAAAFSVGDHRKLTRWVAVRDMPFDLSLRERRSPYGGLGWDAYPAYTALPPEVAALLKE